MVTRTGCCLWRWHQWKLKKLCKGLFIKFNVAQKTKLLIIFARPPLPPETKLTKHWNLWDEFRSSGNIELYERPLSFLITGLDKQTDTFWLVISKLGHTQMDGQIPPTIFISLFCAAICPWLYNWQIDCLLHVPKHIRHMGTKDKIYEQDQL